MWLIDKTRMARRSKSGGSPFTKKVAFAKGKGVLPARCPHKDITTVSRCWNLKFKGPDACVKCLSAYKNLK